MEISGLRREAPPICRGAGGRVGGGAGEVMGCGASAVSRGVSCRCRVELCRSLGQGLGSGSWHPSAALIPSKSRTSAAKSGEFQCKNKKEEKKKKSRYSGTEICFDFP